MLIINYHSSSFGGEGCWNENLWEGLRVETSLKISMVFLLFVNLRVVQKSEHVKLYS